MPEVNLNDQNSKKFNFKNLLLVTHSLPFSKGEEFLYPEIEELSKKFNLYVVPFAPMTSEKHKEIQATVFKIKLTSPSTFLKAFLAAIKRPIITLKLFLKMLSSRNIPIFQANLRAMLKAALVCELLKNKNIFHVHAYWATNAATMAYCISKYLNIPFSFTAHRHDIVDDNLLLLKSMDALFVRFISKSGLNMAKKITKDKLPEKKLKVLHLGIKLPKKPETKINKNDEINFLCPARFVEVKGHKYLLRAFKLLLKDEDLKGKKIRLLLAGSGPLFSDLKNLAFEMGISSKVDFLGYVPNEEILKMYENKEVFCVVLPSLDLGKGLKEGIPFSLIEAMSFGIPVISTNTGGIPELLGEIPELMVKQADEKAIYKKMKELLESRDYYLYASTKVREIVEKEFNVEKIASKLTDYFFLNQLTSQETS